MPPTPVGAGGNVSAGKSKSQKQPGNDIVVTATVELLGVGLLTLLAGANPQLGRIVVIVMVGFLLGWLLVHANEMQGWLKKV